MKEKAKGCTTLYIPGGGGANVGVSEEELGAKIRDCGWLAVVYHHLLVTHREE